MIQRLVAWAIQSYIRGPSRSWIYTSLALWAIRLIRRVTGRRPVTETLSVSPGQKVTIEALDVTHRRQIKDEKRARRRRTRS